MSDTRQVEMPPLLACQQGQQQQNPTEELATEDTPPGDDESLSASQCVCERGWCSIACIPFTDNKGECKTVLGGLVGLLLTSVVIHLALVIIFKFRLLWDFFSHVAWVAKCLSLFTQVSLNSKRKSTQGMSTCFVIISLAESFGWFLCFYRNNIFQQMDVYETLSISWLGFSVASSIWLLVQKVRYEGAIALRKCLPSLGGLAILTYLHVFFPLAGFMEDRFVQLSVVLVLFNAFLLAVTVIHLWKCLPVIVGYSTLLFHHMVGTPHDSAPFRALFWLGILKYLPQVHENKTQNTTAGWSLWHVILVAINGSIYFVAEWWPELPYIAFLSLVGSMLSFCVVLLLQHYLWSRIGQKTSMLLQPTRLTTKTTPMRLLLQWEVANMLQVRKRPLCQK